VIGPDPEPGRGYFYRSDHFPLAKAGVPAVSLADPREYLGRGPAYAKQVRDEYNDTNYHQPSDEYRSTWDMTGAIEDMRLLDLIKESHSASDRVYGSLRVFKDLREAGVRIGRKRVARIMRQHKIHAVSAYKAPRYIRSVPSIAIPNRLNRQFNVAERDHVWVTDITYIRTWQGWLYLAVVMDLHSRKVVGWSMKSSLARGIPRRASASSLPPPNTTSIRSNKLSTS
jgi:putative transposase